MARHRVYLPDCDPTPGSIIEIIGPEALHAARAKRMGVGEELELFNGRGRRVAGAIREVYKLPGCQGRPEWALRVEVEHVTEEAPIRPRVTVFASAPKGPRLEEMVDQLSQVGVARWAPLMVTRTVVSPRAGKILKAERVAIESAKQCGRAWTMEIGEPTTLAGSLPREYQGCGAGTRLVLADASGGRYESDDAGDIRLLVGPEGGFAADEIQAAREAGAVVCRFAPHVLRVETAAVVAAAVILDARVGTPE